MPTVWNDTVDAHRRTVRDAIIDSTAELVGHHGLRGVTMSQIAETSGIGRATLYRYFPDLDSILRAWHERQIDDHVAHLTAVRDDVDDPARRLAAVLEAYAHAAYGSSGHDDPALTAVLHRDRQLETGQQQVLEMVREMLLDDVRHHRVRDDVPLDELAQFCVCALAAARPLTDHAAIRRLVDLTVAGLRPSVSS